MPSVPVRIDSETYRKIILMKGKLEVEHQVPLSIGDTIDVIFTAMSYGLAENTAENQTMLTQAAQSVVRSGRRQPRVAGPTGRPGPSDQRRARPAG